LRGPRGAAARNFFRTPDCVIRGRRGPNHGCLGSISPVTVPPRHRLGCPLARGAGRLDPATLVPGPSRGAQGAGCWGKPAIARGGPQGPERAGWVEMFPAGRKEDKGSVGGRQNPLVGTLFELACVCFRVPSGPFFYGISHRAGRPSKLCRLELRTFSFPGIFSGTFRDQTKRDGFCNSYVPRAVLRVAVWAGRSVGPGPRFSPDSQKV